MVHPEQRSTLYIDEFKGFCLNVDKADEGLHPKYSDNLSSRTGTDEEKGFGQAQAFCLFL